MQQCACCLLSHIKFDFVFEFHFLDSVTLIASTRERGWLSLSQFFIRNEAVATAHITDLAKLCSGAQQPARLSEFFPTEHSGFGSRQNSALLFVTHFPSVFIKTLTKKSSKNLLHYSTLEVNVMPNKYDPVPHEQWHG